MLFDEAVAHLKAGRSLARWDWFGVSTFEEFRDLAVKADQGDFFFDRCVYLKFAANCEGAFISVAGKESPWKPAASDWVSGAWFVLDRAQCVSKPRPWWRFWG